MEIKRYRKGHVRMEAEFGAMDLRSPGQGMSRLPPLLEATE